MKAITLYPEWAWTICNLDKNIENRTYPPDHGMVSDSRYTLAIHAGKNIGGTGTGQDIYCGLGHVMTMAGQAGWLSDDSFNYDKKYQTRYPTYAVYTNVKKDGFKVTFTRDGESKILRDSDLICGAVVAVTRVLTYNKNFHRKYWPKGVDNEDYSPWAASGQWHWKLGNIFVLPEPVSCRGYQRWWSMPEDVEKKVMEQIR